MNAATKQRAAIKKFIDTWKDRGDEKQDTQQFWTDLLHDVYGVENVSQYIEFEKKVQLLHQSYIDAYISTTKVLIEQKSADVDLSKGQRQSDGSVLSPYSQARRYAGYLPHDENPKWIVVSNFKEFRLYNMNRPNDEPQIVKLEDLENEAYRMKFLVDTGDENTKRELKISMDAGRIVGALYDALLAQYKDPDDPETLKSLNMLCVRLVFCLYAEDAGIFGAHGMFHDYLKANGIHNVRRALIDLFDVLNTPEDARDPYMEESLAAFPYVNGGLFADKDVVIPTLDEHIVELILQRASADFDWSAISPTIFGAVFESTLNPETRRAGGMHYTSIENIHKVIDPLFLDDLRDELQEIQEIKVTKTRKQKLQDFQDKLAGLTFLDPACGSGNFLTETYLSLRRLENEVLRSLYNIGSNQMMIGAFGDDYLNVKVSIDHFHGIEINDFAVSVAKTALWIAEAQMLSETILSTNISDEFLPLTTSAHIVEGNALRMDWETVLPKNQLDYIMGNPPFVGKKEQSKVQKSELVALFPKKYKGIGNLDYVSGWYLKAAEFSKGTSIRCAFVSTNSITQGEQVPVLWNYLLSQEIYINFAYRTFCWNSEATDQAHVHCVIIGFSHEKLRGKKKLFLDEKQVEYADNINPYLIDAPSILISSRTKALCDVPPISYGSMPIDDGHLILSKDDVETLLKENPENEKFIRKYVGGAEILKGKERWCLWLQGASPGDFVKSKFILERIRLTAEFRKQSGRPQTLALAETPTLFGEIRQPDTTMLVIPKVSSERRRYIPIAYIEPEIIVNGSALIVPDATPYHFGVLISNIHNAWMRTVAGRMKSDYQYSGNVVYNNFPWPDPTDAQRVKIEQTAQAILATRAKYADMSLADMYGKYFDVLTDLITAHQNNDKAVAAAYGLNKNSPEFKSESACVAMLMRMYQQLTEKK